MRQSAADQGRTEAALMGLNSSLADHLIRLYSVITTSLIPFIHDKVSSIGVEQACAGSQRLVHLFEVFPFEAFPAFRLSGAISRTQAGSTQFATCVYRAATAQWTRPIRLPVARGARHTRRCARV